MNDSRWVKGKVEKVVKRVAKWSGPSIAALLLDSERNRPRKVTNRRKPIPDGVGIGPIVARAAGRSGPNRKASPASSLKSSAHSLYPA